jgi:hypothetical protein
VSIEHSTEGKVNRNYLIIANFHCVFLEELAVMVKENSFSDFYSRSGGLKRKEGRVNCC